MIYRIRVHPDLEDDLNHLIKKRSSSLLTTEKEDWAAGAVLLTTDDAIIKVIKRHRKQITIEVKNPVEWLMEVDAHGGKDVE